MRVLRMRVEHQVTSRGGTPDEIRMLDAGTCD